MSSLKQGINNLGVQLRSQWVVALVMTMLGAFFIAWGVYRFRVRPDHFGWLSVLLCVVGAFGAFFLLIVSDYVFHHAPLVFIPFFIFLIYFTIINPYLAVGMGLALWGMLRSQLSG